MDGLLPRQKADACELRSTQHLLPHAVQVVEPCFTNATLTPDMSSNTLTIGAGWLPAGNRTYTIMLTAAKGSRSDSATATVRVLAEEAPTGTVR